MGNRPFVGETLKKRGAVSMHPSFRALCSTYSLGGLSSVSQTTEDYKVSRSWAGDLHCLHVFCVCVCSAETDRKRNREKSMFPRTLSNPLSRKYFWFFAAENKIYLQFTLKQMRQIVANVAVHKWFDFHFNKLRFIAQALKNKPFVFNCSINSCRQWFVLHNWNIYSQWHSVNKSSFLNQRVFPTKYQIDCCTSLAKEEVR